MIAPTHIIGGTVFSGTMCAFFDVNIFSDWKYLAVCAGFSLLPDIDTTKSFVGKIFYPFAWVINRKFGHRTITHSLLFFALVWAVIFALLKFGIVQDENVLKIALFSLFSHFIFDMLTVSGVPLLYPFFPNPCVVPGNPAFRFKSGDFRAEIVVCGICGLLCITMQPLFANGFWTSYNRFFATVQHVNRENQNTEFYVTCEYSYIRNAQTFIGQALVIESTDNELILFDRKQIFTLSSKDPQTKVNYAKPIISDVPKRFTEFQFFSVSLDSLQNMLSDRLASGLIQSNYNVRYIEEAITYNTNFIKFSNRFDFHIYANADSSRTTTRAQISKLEASINQHRAEYNTKLSDWREYQTEIEQTETLLKSENLSNYERNKNQRHLMQLRNRTYPKPVFVPLASQMAELESLKKSLSERYLLFSGHFTVYQFGEVEEEQEVKPIYEVSKSVLLANLH